MAGQQGHGAAEEHGEEVEGDGAEQDRSPADEAQALQRVVEAGSGGLVALLVDDRRHLGLGGRVPGADADDGVGQRAQEVEHGHGDERGRRVDGVEGPAQDRAHDQGELPGGRVAGDQPGQVLRGEDVGGQGPAGGGHEGGGDPRDDHEGEDREDRARRGAGVGGQRGGHGGGDQRPHTADQAPVDPVGDRSGEEHQQQDRQELGQTDQPQVELPPGQVEDQLAQGGDPGQVARRAQERPGDQRLDRPVPVALPDRVRGGRHEAKRASAASSLSAAFSNAFMAWAASVLAASWRRATSATSSGRS